MKKWLCFLCCFCLLPCLFSPLLGCAEGGEPHNYAWKGTSVCFSYTGKNLSFTIERGRIGEEAICYFTKLWMKNPGQQIKKVTAPWREALAYPGDMALELPSEAALAVNGSGFVSPQFPEIPENYPGTSEDYYYSPLGSLTVTDGKIYRNLEGVPFYGLTLQADGLHIHAGEDIHDVLAGDPSQTWSFYEGCTLVVDHRSLLDEDWVFAKRRAIRNILSKIDDHNYLIVTATSTMGLTLVDAVPFLMKEFDPEWVYNLDGGSSAALMARRPGQKNWRIIYGNRVRVTDIMAFCEGTEP